VVYQVSADRPTNGTTHTPPALCGLMGGALGGLAVLPPASFGFPFLGGGGLTHDLYTNATHLLPAGSPATVVRAVGLMTCASVIYYSNAGAAYIHHANAGDVTAANFNTALAALGIAAANAWIIYAHNKPTDPGYQASLASFVVWGVPANNITEITDLFYPNFGINNFGWLGY
jgi:hypothetical protein